MSNVKIKQTAETVIKTSENIGIVNERIKDVGVRTKEKINNATEQTNSNSPEQYAVENLLMTAIFVFIMQVYTGVAYKYFVVSMCVMMVTIYAFMFNSDRIMEKLMSILSSLSLNSFGAVIVIGYVAIVVGGVLEYLLSCLFYKKPLSKMAFGAALKRAAQ